MKKEKTKMRIMTPKKIGCCFGVKRAIKLTEDVLSNRKPAYIFGELVHNETITRKLCEEGLKMVEGMNDVKDGTLIIRAHGLSPDELNKAEEKRIEIVDATCPIVRQAQNAAKKLEEEGYQVVIVGDKDHAEIKGIVGHLKNEAIVVANHKEIQPAKLKRKVGLIFQTTHSIEFCKDVVAEVMKVAHDIKIINTICADIRRRQEDAVKIARVVDLMIVVGSHHSSNTIKLKKLCQKYNKNTVQIETAKDLSPSELRKARSIGIVGGASTPDVLIEEVKQKLKSYIKMKRTAIVFALFSEFLPTALRLGVSFLKVKQPQIILDDKNIALIRGGIGKDKAIKAAERVILEFRPQLIISAGLCGALVENLKVGDIVVSDFKDGKIFCSPRPLLTYNEKLNAHREHGAVVVDMESEGVRIIAGKYNIPSVAIKAVSDGLRDDIPKSLLTFTSLLKLIRFKRSMDIASKRLSEFLLTYIMEANRKGDANGRGEKSF